MTKPAWKATTDAIKSLPVIGPPATAAAARVPSLYAIRTWRDQLWWWMDAMRHLRPGAAVRATAIVTGADATHFRSQINMLRSVREHEPQSDVSFWDLGLDSAEREELMREFPDVTVTTFPYQDFPSYFRIEEQAGQYAWKPVIIEREVVARPDAIVIWLDAGCLIDRPLSWMRRFAHADGFYSPRSEGTVSTWTHPGTVAFLRAETSILSRRNLNGAVVAIDTSHARARRLVQDWADCARSEECIAPSGSSRDNHRQDQAVLSVLAHQSHLAPRGCHADLSPQLGVLTHQDVD